MTDLHPNTGLPAEYRPKRTTSLVIAAIWLATGGLLAWLGFVLGPEDRKAMEGFTRLLFEAVPISLFSWTMSVVFIAFGALWVHRVFRREPTLVVHEAGLRLASGKEVTWDMLHGIEAGDEDSLKLLGHPDSRPEGRPGFLQRFGKRGGRDNSIASFSALELGADVQDLATRIEALRDLARETPSQP